MDRQSGRVVAFDAESRTTWTFDVCTNTWRRMRPAQEPLMGGCRMVYDAGADLTVAFPRGGDPTPWAYSADDNAWKQLPAADPSPTSFHALKDLAYDSASGRVFLRDSETTELWSYAVETNTWTQVDQGADVLAENPDQQSGVPHFHSLLDYDTAADRLVVTALGGSGAESGETWTFDTHLSAWTKKDAVPPGLNTGFFESGGEVAFDEARGVTVVFSDGVLATYDAVADKWTRIEPGPGWPSVDEQDGFLIGPLARLSHSLVYDPVNERILMFGGHARMPAGWKDLDDVWAFDLSTNSWIELVRARER